MLKGMGMGNISTEDLMALLMEVDEDGSGLIEYPEFATMMASQYSTERTQRKEICKAFQLFEEKDVEFDLLPGKITFDHLRALARDLGETLSDEDLKEMIEEGDPK